MAVKIEKRSFGKTARGESVTLFKIETPELTACVLDYGATVQACSGRGARPGIFPAK